MNLAKILDELRLEREQIEEAIISLERLAAHRSKRRGRPPKWLAEAKKRARNFAARAEGQTKSNVA